MGIYRFITRQDCHLSDRPPASRIDDYKQSIFEKLDQIYQMAEERECNAILDAGDFFHVKAPTKNSHELTGEVATQHNKYKVPVYSIIGNHDVLHGNAIAVHKQPLGVLFQTNTFHRLVDTTFGDVRVIGIDYSLDSNDELKKRCVKGDEKILIAVFHGNVSELSLFPSEKFYSFRGLSQLDPDVWILGHIHKDQGIHKINDRYFISPGAVSRGALTYDEITRNPKIGYLEIDTDSGEIKAEEIDLKVKDSSEVFDLEVSKKKKEEDGSIDEFIQSLVSIKDESPEDKLNKTIETMGLAKEVRNMIYHYIEKAEENV